MAGGGTEIKLSWQRGKPMNNIPVIKQTNIPGGKLISRGKVRDIYDAGDYLLLVTSDRISAYDVVMDEGIPLKGVVLNQISKFWFDHLQGIIPNHFISDDTERFPAPFHRFKPQLLGRSMLVRKAKPLPVECIVRGYLAGSGWREYREKGTLHGAKIVAGLQQSEKFPEPLFTPSTKAESGHDENISFSRMAEMIGHDLAARIRDISLQLYQKAAGFAENRGIIIADTKFEFGLINDDLILIDEALTPDSSRFWPKSSYRVGQSQASLDKQYLRDYLDTLDWDKTPPAPQLPPEIIKNTSQKYQEIYRILTGKNISEVLV